MRQVTPQRDNSVSSIWFHVRRKVATLLAE
jgi:hypothetical protein